MAIPAVKVRQRINQIAPMARPDVRAKMSMNTKLAMADPEVRTRIVTGRADGAKISAGIQRSFAADHDEKALREMWLAAPTDVRRKFLETLTVPPVFAWAVSREGEANG
jgi:hypothetical protein